MSIAWTFGYLVGISPALVIVGLFLYAAYKFNPKG